MSTCSEVVLNDVEELVFETPDLLDDLKFSTEEIEAVTEQPSLSTLVVSTAQCPTVHTLEAVLVKVKITENGHQKERKKGRVKK